MVPPLANTYISYGCNDLLVDLNSMQIDICLNELIVVMDPQWRVVVHRRESQSGNARRT